MKNKQKSVYYYQNVLPSWFERHQKHWKIWLKFAYKAISRYCMTFLALFQFSCCELYTNKYKHTQNVGRFKYLQILLCISTQFLDLVPISRTIWCWSIKPFHATYFLYVENLNIFTEYCVFSNRRDKTPRNTSKNICKMSSKCVF